MGPIRTTETNGFDLQGGNAQKLTTPEKHDVTGNKVEPKYEHTTVSCLIIILCNRVPFRPGVN